MSAASERVVLNTQLLPQPVNSVIVNPSSTPIDDHSDHDHNDVHVADECIPPPGFRCPAVSSDTRYAPAVNSRRAPTVNMATSRQQPPGSGPPSDYRYLGACSYSCQNCGALFWGEERLKSVPRGSCPRYNRCCRGGRVVLRTYQVALATDNSVGNLSVLVVSDRFVTEKHSPLIHVVAYVPTIGFPLVVAPPLASLLLILLSFARYPLATVLSPLPMFAPILYQVAPHQKA
ncbi:hypothetical protein Tco_1490109 [Tanacetum coccineum]